MDDRLKSLSFPEFGRIAKKLDDQPDTPEDRQTGDYHFTQMRVYQIIRRHQAEHTH